MLLFKFVKLDIMNKKKILLKYKKKIFLKIMKNINLRKIRRKKKLLIFDNIF